LITKVLGGQLRLKPISIDNFFGLSSISNDGLANHFEKLLMSKEIPIFFDEVIRIKKGKQLFVLTRSGYRYTSNVVIIASGCEQKQLSIPGEKQFLNKGVYYTAGAPSLYEGKSVAIVGGGNSGFDMAEYIKQYARKVFILECQRKVKAFLTNQQKVKGSEKVKILTNVGVKEILGQKTLDSLIYEEKKTGKIVALPVDIVVITIGQTPNTSFVKGLVELNERGEVVINPYTCETNAEGIFAAGDCTSIKWKQAVIAYGEGAKAALSAYEYLEKIKR
jgi:alkyl hydroperoxide reductase subunit AhpF